MAAIQGAGIAPIDAARSPSCMGCRQARADRERPGVVVLDPHKLIVGKAQYEAGMLRYRDWTEGNRRTVEKLEVIKECGTCHEHSLETYRDTFHGQVTSLGYANVATCDACHGAHQVLPASNPASKGSKENRLKTCQACHALPPGERRFLSEAAVLEEPLLRWAWTDAHGARVANERFPGRAAGKVPAHVFESSR